MNREFRIRSDFIVRAELFLRHLVVVVVVVVCVCVCVIPSVDSRRVDRLGVLGMIELG